jgi:hypothetical protein
MHGKRSPGSVLYGYAKSALLRCAETLEKARLRPRLPRMPADDRRPVVVTVVRDEALRLEYFFAYYKALGISRFIVLDHQSADRSAELIDAEASAIRIPVTGNFIFKRAWIQTVVESMAGARWCLVVDADEFLVWPRMHELSLDELIAYMEERGFEALPCLLLDMYPKEAVEDVRYRPGEDPLRHAPFFDREGTPRQRSFGVAPTLTKCPLLRFRRGMRLRQGQHGVYRARYADVGGVLLHFKFLQDFSGKIRSNPLIRTFDSAYGKELSAYQRRAEEKAKLVLHSEDSVLYRGPEQLLELGLMQDSPDFRDFARSAAGPRRRSED